MPKIEFYGACETVTGSKFIVSNNDTKVLLDCGMYQGRKDDAYLQNKEFSEDVPYVDHCVLSHAHIDHSGMLPSLVTNSTFTGKIYSTHPTFDLCKHMLKDSVAVFTKELPVISKMLRKRKIHTLVEALYTIDDVDSCISRFSPIDYEEDVKLTDNISFSLHDSCHILGSASIKVNITENTITHKIWYTSDIGHDKSLLSNTPKVPLDINHLVIESTYGNKKRPEEDVVQKVMNAINDASKRGGKIIIPTFSVQRMQTMLLIIHKLHIMGYIPNIPIYVDSPLGVKVTHLYEKYEDELNQEIIRFFKNNGYEPFIGPMIKYVSEMVLSKEIATSDEQMIILSASGMCEGGHVREHLKWTLPDKNSTVLFVGYNAEGTLGRRIQDSSGTVNIDGLPYRVRSKVETVQGFSAHADLDYLINYIEAVTAGNAIKNIFLVHGDPDAIKNVKSILNSKGITNVIIPERNKQYKL